MSAASMIRRSVAAALLSLSLAASAGASKPVYEEVNRIDLTETFHTASKWQAVLYSLKKDPAKGSDYDSALEDVSRSTKFCLIGGKRRTVDACEKVTQAGENRLPADDFAASSIWVQPALQFSHKDPAKGLVIESDTSYGGSGSRLDLAVLTYDPRTDEFTTLFSDKRSNVSDREFFTDGPLDGYYVSAEKLWIGREEGHYSPHRFRVTIYQYIPNEGYIEILSYVTQTKYDSLTEAHAETAVPLSAADKARGVIGYDAYNGPVVIKPELTTIRRLLAAVYPHGISWPAAEETP